MLWWDWQIDRVPLSPRARQVVNGCVCLTAFSFGALIAWLAAK
jgi:hypothetical protein